MMPRTEYEMDKADLAKILQAGSDDAWIRLRSHSRNLSGRSPQCGTPPSPQENANHAWAMLGKELGFDSMTVRPIQGKGQRFFTAVPSLGR